MLIFSGFDPLGYYCRESFVRVCFETHIQGKIDGCSGLEVCEGSGRCVAFPDASADEVAGVVLGTADQGCVDAIYQW